jgi:hypothetical protein
MVILATSRSFTVRATYLAEALGLARWRGLRRLAAALESAIDHARLVCRGVGKAPIVADVDYQAQSRRGIEPPAYKASSSALRAGLSVVEVVQRTSNKWA